MNLLSMLQIQKKQYKTMTLIKSWFNNINNKKIYGDADFKELQETLRKDIIESRLMFGVKNHPKFVIDNPEAIEKLVGADKVRKVIEDATKKIASDVQFNVSREKALDKFE